jgi:biopolymer transport protein ExbB
MIRVFSSFSGNAGIANPAQLAGGISEILVTTAAGLAIAIPSLMFHRHFQARVEALSLRMEDESLRFLNILLGQEESDS